MAVPSPTARLRFREMAPSDLPAMMRLLGDPDVMHFYPSSKSHREVADWIEWNEAGYRNHGHGLWIVETLEGEFVGDCGLTWQEVNGSPRLEVGYHVLSVLQGRGFATEAAAACRDFAREALDAAELIAITHPENRASQRVAEHIGMTRLEDGFDADGRARTVHGMRL